MEIRYMQFQELSDSLQNVCSKIASMYGLSIPNNEYCSILTNTLKKHYGLLTIEQIELAFEYNSQGYLNSYLPKYGTNIDNKVKFTIPDFTKILKAFIKCKKLNIQAEDKNEEPQLSELDTRNKKWCADLEEIFYKYKIKKERSFIPSVIFNCYVLVKLDLLDRNKIGKRSTNEDLIYECFDTILEHGETLSKFLQPFRERYSEQIPIY